jgi:hypothetical protein
MSTTPSNLSGADAIDLLKERISSIPESEKRKKQLDAIVEFNEDLDELIRVRKNLNLIAEFEHTLATGLSDESVSSSRLRETLKSILADEKLQYARHYSFNPLAT